MAGVSISGPGAIRVRPGDLEINADRGHDECGELRFTNTADRPIQVGSHLHLPDVNPSLKFDRAAAAGFRLDIPAGTCMRFEPGASRTAGGVALEGRKGVPRLHNKTTRLGGSR